MSTVICPVLLPEQDTALQFSNVSFYSFPLWHCFQCTPSGSKGVDFKHLPTCSPPRQIRNPQTTTEMVMGSSLHFG